MAKTYIQKWHISEAKRIAEEAMKSHLSAQQSGQLFSIANHHLLLALLEED